MTQHIFLTGKKQVGKSTLIKKLLEDYKGIVDGFLTVRTKEYLGEHYSVHIYHLTETQRPDTNNLLFVCGEADEQTINNFDQLGYDILSRCSSCSLLVMDELGPHEAKAALFRQKILSLLDSQIPILGVLQDPAEIYWPEIADHPNVELITIDENNRNDSSLIEHIRSNYASF